MVSQKVNHLVKLVQCALRWQSGSHYVRVMVGLGLVGSMTDPQYTLHG